MIARAALSPIPMPDPEPISDRQDLLARVAAVRDTTEEVFLATGSQLIELASLLDSARQGALSLKHITTGALLDRLHDEAGQQQAVFDDLLRDFERVDTCVLALMGSLGQLTSDLQDVRRAVVMMRMVVLNSRVTLSTLDAQDQRLSSFAEDGQTVVSETVDVVSQFERTVRAIGKLVQNTALAVTHTRARLAEDVLTAFRTVTKDISGFEAGVRAISRQGNGLPESLQSLLDATAAAVSGLQIGDSTRQQLDHVAYILALPEGDDPSLRALAEALIVDASGLHSQTLEALRQDVGYMISTVKELVEVHLAGFLEASGKTAAPDVLQLGSSQLDTAIRALHPLKEQAEALEQEMAREFEVFRDLISRGEDVQSSTWLIGINAVLSCTRLGSDGLALKVVARQLQEVAKEVGAGFSAMRTTLDRIGAEGAEATLAIGSALRNSIEMPERLVSAINPMIDEVTTHLRPVSTAVQRLRDRLSDLHLDFGPALRHSGKLRDLTEGLPSTPAPQPSDTVPDETLSKIAAVFTIQRERDVFRTIFPDRADLLSSAHNHQVSALEDDGFLL